MTYLHNLQDEFEEYFEEEKTLGRFNVLIRTKIEKYKKFNKTLILKQYLFINCFYNVQIELDYNETKYSALYVWYERYKKRYRLSEPEEKIDKVLWIYGDLNEVDKIIKKMIRGYKDIYEYIEHVIYNDYMDRLFKD